ncbi:MAG: flagellar hook-basal body complex protein FliE [Lentisphaeraceae bacterium]|nr:flagellar hook-basal body complex protein FliE [Lentisphaeraceae bacterium]
MINEINPQSEMLQTQLEQLQKLHQQTQDVSGDKNAPAFDEVLSQLIQDVDVAQKEADTSIKQLASGESTSIQDVVMKMEEADIAFQLMKEVRNKLLEAYKEVLTMSS